MTLRPRRRRCNAFGINNHREAATAWKILYVDDVRAGLAVPRERAVAGGDHRVQPAGNPDTNGNGIGLQYPTGSRRFT